MKLRLVGLMAVALGLAGALALAGCSGDDDDEAGGGETTEVVPGGDEEESSGEQTPGNENVDDNAGDEAVDEDAGDEAVDEDAGDDPPASDNPPTGLRAPTLVAPANGVRLVALPANGNMVAVTLSWSRVKGAERYRYRILVSSFEAGEDTTGTSAPSMNLGVGNYSWKVASVRGATVLWSDTWRFTIVPL